jgi:PAS domain S-box-containing protein
MRKTGRHSAKKNVFREINSEDRFNLVFNGTNDAIFIHDPSDGSILDFNDRTCEMYGYERDEMIGFTVADISANMPPYSLKEASSYIRDSLSKPQQFEWLCRRKDHSLFWVTVSLRTVTTGNELITIAYVRDESARKQAEDSLLKETNFVNAILDSVPGLIYMYDKNGRLVRWNKKHEELSGYSSEELSGMTLADWYKGDPETLNMILSRVQDAYMYGRADAEALLRNKDGSRVLYYLTAVPLTIGEEQYIVGAGIDISERKKRENALEKSEAEFRSLFEASPAGAVTVVNRRFEKVSRRFLAMTGYEESEIAGKSTEMIYPDNEMFLYVGSNLYQTIRDKGIGFSEAVIRRKDGSLIDVSIHANVIDDKNPDGNLSCIIEDITERKEKERELERSEAEFRSLFRAIPSGSAMIVDRVFKKVSSQFTRILGYSEEDLVNQSVRMAYPSDEEFLRAGKELYRIDPESGIGKVEAKLRCKNGRIIDVIISQCPLNAGDVSGGVCVAFEDVTEKKKKEEALIKSEAEYRSLFETSPTGSVIFVDRHFKRISRHFLSMIGYEEDELIGKSTRIMYPDDEVFNKVGLELYGAIDRTGFGKVETVLKRKDGDLIDVILNANPLNPKDPSEGISSVFEDITERKKYERELIRSEVEYRSLFEASPSGAGTVVNGKIGKVSRRIQEMLGYSEEDLSGQSTRIIYPDDDHFLEAEAELRDLILKNGYGKVETVFMRKDGSLLNVLISACPLNPQDLSEGISCIFEDISELKRKTEELARRETEFRTLFEVSPVGVSVLVDRRFKRVSGQFCRITGYSEEELIGQLSQIIYPDEETFISAGNTLYPSGEVPGYRRMETIVKRKSGEIINVLLAVAPLDPSDPAKGYCGILDDITEQKRLSEALERRLISLTRPIEVSDISFGDLFDIDAIQRLQDLFAKAFGVASLISSPDGTPITRPSGFCDFCNIIRKTEIGARKCEHSDSIIGRINESGPTIQRCLSGGLLDGGVNITVGGHHIANWFVGQIRDESLSDEEMMKFAEEIGADKDLYRNALKNVPKMSLEKFKLVSETLFEIAAQLSTIAYQNIQQARFIVDLKKTEESLRQFQYSIDNAFDSVFWVASDGKFSYVNEQACRSLGYSNAELLGMHVWDVNSAYTEDSWPEYWDTAKNRTGILYESVHRRKDGSLFPVEIASSYFSGKEPVRIAIIRDISDRKREEERYKIILQASMDGFAIIDSTGFFVDMNDAYGSIVGYDKSELISRKSDIVAVKDDASDISWNFEKIRHHGYWRFETLFRKKSGEIINVEASVYRLNTEDGYYCVFIRDITERKINEERIKSINIDLENRVQLRTIELEEKSRILAESLRQLESAQHQLVVSERMAAIGSLVAGVAHEINTPLGVGVTAASFIETSAEKLMREISDVAMDSDKIRSGVRALNESAALLMSNLTKAAELVQGFKQVAVDQTSGEKRKFKLHEYIDNIIQSLHPYTKKFPVKIINDCPEDIEIDTYPGGLSQVITNLINNSIIHAFPVEREEVIRIRVYTADSKLIIEYSDNGKGIPSEIIDKIFDPFFTTRRNEGGSGLGLHIVFKIVNEQMRGDMVCESKQGEGTIFKMRFGFDKVGLDAVAKE